MKKERQLQTRMFISYIVIPIAILLMFSVLFTVAYYSMSKVRILTFEDDTADNVDNQMKEVIDNLLKSASQYSMTPWVKRLKYMQKMPELMKENITASDISDYASSLALTEINDSIIESIYIYYSTGEFGITSIGKINWKGYTDIYQIESANQDFMNGDILKQNNQHVLCHNVTMIKNAKKIQGFFLIQTIPLENSYSGEVNILFFIPYENLYNYIAKFADDGMKQVCLTDGSKVLYTEVRNNGEPILEKDAYIGTYDHGDQNLYYQKQLRAYIAVYSKTGMDIGIIQIVDNQFLSRDFWAFFRWILFVDSLLSIFIFLVSLQQTKRSYQPIGHIVQLLDTQGETAANADEYEMIERALRDLESQKKKLEVSVYEQNPMIEQYILYGLLNEQRMDEKEERYINMVRQFANFRVMVLNDGSDAEPYIDEIDEQLAIYPQIHTAFLREGKCYLWVLNYGEENLITEIMELLTQVFSDLNWKEAVLGLGAAHEDIRELAKAYQEAKQAIKYHFFFGEEHVIIYDREEICHRGEKEVYFMVTQEEKRQMEDAVANLDADRLLQVCTTVLRRNSANPFMQDDEWRTGAIHLSEWVFASFKGYGELPELTETIDPVKYNTFEAYISVFASRLENRIECSRNRENPAYVAKNDKIRKYVEEHLTDANLSLNETARIMHYTATYFGKYFKEQFGCAFQEYVAVRRIECAKECLSRDPQGKKKSIQEIALQCGFTNDVTFRRTFKRYTGVTPSQFCKDEE